MLILLDKLDLRHSWNVFFFTISLVILSLIPVVFPSFIVANFTQVNELEQLGISGKQIEPYEVGPLADHILIYTNFVFKSHTRKII